MTTARIPSMVAMVGELKAIRPVRTDHTAWGNVLPVRGATELRAPDGGAAATRAANAEATPEMSATGATTTAAVAIVTAKGRDRRLHGCRVSVI